MNRMLRVLQWAALGCACWAVVAEAGVPGLGIVEPSPPAPAPLSAYDRTVLADSPQLYLPLGGASGLVDASGHHHDGVAHHAPGTTSFLNGDLATRFNGVDQYIEVKDKDSLSITAAGVLTMEAWVRPDVLNFSHEESADQPYVHWMGKSTNGQSEYVARMYSHDADWAGDGIDPPRPNRISGYAFNLGGGLGAGSYFQDAVGVGQWIHYVLVINTNKRSGDYPTGYTKVYKNGQLRDQDALADYDIDPGNGTAPFRIGSARLEGFFEGAIAKVALYKRELKAAQVLRHYQAATAAR
ncbi:LamG-like jellyroll fold domain-containing protein [Ideonella sp.]|uniref:LamG-like jellyroll fold domain-containing protein n=1 Tax=Ideonella sp. TaxID=1929293 RepID=UPI0035B39519